MEIGKFYQVPAVLVNEWHGFAGWLPVIGPKHEDAEFINFPWDHFHIDWRFAPKGLFDQMAGYFQRGPSGVFGFPIQDPDSRKRQVITEGPVPRRMTFKRELPPFPWREAKWLPELQAKYACAKLAHGKCPHRGIPVEAMIRHEGGILECPGHGLRWNAATGEAVTS